MSTCKTTVKEGDHANKGDEIGKFHGGGSMYCLLFRDGANVTGFPEAGQSHNIPVRGELVIVQ